jgi:hypothetical protein
MRANRLSDIGCSSLAERFLKEAADTTLERQLAGRLVAELSSIPEDERQRLRDDWVQDEPAVIETAADLNGEVLETISGAADADSPAGRQYLAPYSACTIGESFMAQGRHVLVD